MEKEVAIALIAALFTFLGALVKVIHWDAKNRRIDSREMKAALTAVGINVAKTHDDMMVAVEEVKKLHTATHNKLDRIIQRTEKND